jgi:hypothetical protein
MGLSRWRSSLLLSSLLFVLCALRPGLARAQNPAAAEALFEQARAAMAAGSYDIACARFRDSDKLDPAVGTRFNLADCEERRGRLATAWSLFRGVLAELAQDDDRKPIAEQRVAKLKPRLPIVTLVLPPEAPPGMHVRLDGVELGEGSFGVPLPMDPGEHDLRLLSPNGAERRKTFTLREGERSDVQLDLDAAEPVSEATLAAEAKPSTGSGRSERRRWALVAGSVGLAGVALGTVAGIVTLRKKSIADDNCPESTQTCNQVGYDANESGKTFAVLSSVGFGVGVVGLATGAYLYLTDKSRAKASAHPSSPIPGAGSGPRDTRQLHAELKLYKSSGFISVAGRF